jgi:hypothetical protein
MISSAGPRVDLKSAGFNNSMKILSVPVTSSLAIKAGAYCRDGNEIAILPPTISMFGQLVNWLSRKTPSDSGRPSTSMIGIGATALCLRWGTYLAVLLDERKQLDPRSASAETSMISDQEMKRINLEFSSNLARLIRLLHNEEAECCRLLDLSYRYLPMPQRRVSECVGFIDPFEALTSPDFWNSAPEERRARINREHGVLTQYCYRILANSVALAAWRNGPIEDVHAGPASGYDLNLRRVNKRKSRALMRFTSEHLAAFLPRFNPWQHEPKHPLPWPQNLAGIYLSPCFTLRSWSLSESSCVVRLPIA